jgi:hypothetical protein
MGLVAVTAALFAVVAYLGRNLAYQWSWVSFIGSLLMLVGLNAASIAGPVDAELDVLPALEGLMANAVLGADVAVLLMDRSDRHA